MDEGDQTTDECGICLEALTAAVTLPCKHKFCANCLNGWKSKFGSTLFSKKKEKSKLCPLCREKIPPSKDMLSQLDYHRAQKVDMEADGDNTSDMYLNHVEQIKRLEAEIGDYEGKGLDYEACMEMPKYIYDAVKTNNIKRVLKWLGSPVDKKKLRAKHPERNYALVHLAVDFDNPDLLSILLQYGADVNALDAVGFTPLMISAAIDVFEPAKLLLEWGVEISLPRHMHVQEKHGRSDREAFIQMAIEVFRGANKMTNLISSEFGGRRCEVINLPNHPHLNGKTCVVEKYITKKDKYKIIFEGSGNAALVGPNNLKRRDRTPLDCGYYISFKNGKISRREFSSREECQAYVASLNGGDVEETTEELASLKV